MFPHRVPIRAGRASGPAPRRTTPLELRPARFEDLAPGLRLIERALERDGDRHYGPAQRRAVYLAYAQNLFIELQGPFWTQVGELEGRLVGLAQVDPYEGRLRALFVDGDWQRQGFGATLLAWAVEGARAAGLARLRGAMSLNAVPFYRRAGFHPTPGNLAIVHAGVSVPVLPMEKPLV